MVRTDDMIVPGLQGWDIGGATPWSDDVRRPLTDPSCFQMEYLLLAVTVSSLARLGEALDNGLVRQIFSKNKFCNFKMMFAGQDSSHGLAGLGEVQV